MNTKEMREKRAAIAAQAFELTKAEMNAETRAKFDAMMADVDVIKADIDRQEKADALELELRSSVTPPRAAPGSAVSNQEETNKAYRSAFDKYLRARKGADAYTRQAELETLLKEVRTYTPMNEATGAAGGFFVPQGFQYEIEQALKSFGGMRQVAGSITTATGNTLPWPTSNDTGVTGELVGENTAVAFANPTIGHVNLNAFKYSTKMVQLSNELLQDSAFDLEAYLRGIFVTRIGRITNNHFTVGVGTTQPNGIVTAATAGPTAQAAGAVSYVDLVELEHSVDPDYRLGATYMLKDSTLKAIKELKDSQGRPLWTAGLASGAPDTILGYKYQINQDMPAIGTGNSQILFGALNKYMIRSVKELSVLRLDERFAEFGQVAFIGFARFDGNLIDAGTHPVMSLVGA